MDAFNWDRNFETGLADVDLQHRQLVNLINRFGELLSLNAAPAEAEMEMVFGELLAYTQYHFREEESLFQSEGLDARFVDMHIQLHRDFLHEAEKMHQDVSPDNRSAAQSMLSYLVHWLAFHILGVDQSMARQIAAIHKGQKPADVYLREMEIGETVTEPLLLALDALFRQVSTQNRELHEFNRTLERKVADRTADLSDANRQLEEMALTDALTGLPNRRHAMARLDKEWKDSVETGNPLACMMIDADGFKQVNDKYGHDAGDEVLRQLSRQLRHAMRTDDAVCRLGGDEFLIICPKSNLDNAMRIAEHLRQHIAQMRVAAGRGEWIGSVSVGVAGRSPEMHNIEDLIKAADDGVYLAKRNGKNRVASSQNG
ncbi:MAG: GGDEF domain-containing protein [Gallionella sp.]